MSAQSQNQPTPGASEEMFLTPRVVDRRAFETFASMLRASVEKAEHESDLLARRAEAAASVLERLEGFVGSHADIFKRAADLIDTIDQRQQTAGDTLESLTKRVELARQASRDVESLVRERGEAFEARLTTLAAGTLDSFEAARQSLSGDASIMRRDLSQRLDELRQRGESLLSSLEERAELAGESLAEQLTSLETARETLRVEHRETARKLDEQSGELRDGLRTEGAAVRRELDAAVRSLREAIAASSAHRDTIERAADLAVSRVQAGAGEQTQEVERLTRRAEALVREHRQSVESLTTEIEARLESARDRAETELGQVSASARSRSREIGASLDERIAAAAAAVATLTGLECITEEAGALLGSIEGRSETIRSEIVALVESACAERVDRIERENTALRGALEAESSRCTSLESALREQLAWIENTDGENAQLRVKLELAEARHTELEHAITLQNGRFTAIEKQLEELAKANSKPVQAAANEAESKREAEPEPEPLIPVVVKPKPRKKAPSRKKAAAKKAAKKTTSKPAAKKASASKAGTKKKAPAATRKAAAVKVEADDAVVEAVTS